MNFILSLVCLLFVTVQAVASTWTLHASKDNYSLIGFRFGIPLGSQTSVIWNYDVPDSSGILLDDFSSGGDVVTWDHLRYQDVWSIDLADDWNWIVLSISGPDPNYEGWQVATIYPPYSAGEYWLDFDSGGILRFSATQPSDFGKWAWDGSINPSWTAAKKGFAKGHNKQLLPSPK